MKKSLLDCFIESALTGLAVFILLTIAEHFGFKIN
jgi:hypothetical protein